MKAVLLLLAAAALPTVHAAEGSPIGKILEMIGELQAKIIDEGKKSQSVYDEFAEWCEDKSKDIGFEIKTSKAAAEDLTAVIEKETSNIAALESKVEDLSASIAEAEANLKDSTALRAKESTDFKAEEQELLETTGALQKAVHVMSKLHGASMVQLQNVQSVAQALNVMVEASAFASADAARLTALIQNQNDDDDESLGAPEADATKDHTGGIAELLQSLLDKAMDKLEKLRRTENEALHNFQALKLSLEDEIKYGNRDMSSAKKESAESAETKSASEGDLEVTKKDLAADEGALATLHQDCMTKAQNFEAETKSRGEELEAIATAKKIIIEATGGAASFIQVSRMASGVELANFEAVRFVRDLARKQKSNVLAMLATRMASAVRSGRRNGQDPFAKVKGLITDMIAKLEQEAAEDATQKAYCDKELGESTAKRDDLMAVVKKHTTNIDQKTAQSEKLKEEVAGLQSDLAKLTKAQAEADKLRQEEKALFQEKEAETSKGLKGVKLALKVLRDYYAKADKAHGAKGDSASGIMNLLEVCESDMSKELAEITADETSAVEEYEQMTKETAVQKTTKTQDVKYKTKESASLDKAISEASSDRAGVQSELDAVLEYLEKVKEKCVAKPESYAEKKARREAEIAGLKDAMEILENESALIQRQTTHLRRK